MHTESFRFGGEHASSGLVDGIQDVSGWLGMVRCVREWCSPLQECLLSNIGAANSSGMLQMGSGIGDSVKNPCKSGSSDMHIYL